jgi:hypothetical protein
LKKFKIQEWKMWQVEKAKKEKEKEMEFVDNHFRTSR